ncbi:dihydrolipoyl dehydrogenase [Egibacter rhizosphaerae]|uniref:Dihydrolipoyl dehydrogenase n=1 Tax=Egibacter rhizosphaerae TaxID=1670831 RepID=A0A411YAJ8_9ACTN|nr:dihydrolipoyl dehydrogenase [Egibacter rhizosphaerae]QBI18226.1 dihydrolipoyl dehydrogenase [Egibacter rhizosphaerae]
MADTYDLIVLGGGTGGYSTALRAAQLGMHVALVEKDKVGGTCLHWGCIPTKAFLQAAEVAEHAQKSDEFGVRATFEAVEMAAVLEYKKGIVDANHKGLQMTLKARGVETIAGTGHLSDHATVTVRTDEGERTLRANRGVVLATGSVPRQLPIEGAETDGERVIDSDHALYLDYVPNRPVIIGAGAIGVEFASVWNAFGSEQVTLIEALDGVVPNEDVDTQKELGKQLKRRGMTAHTGAKVNAVEKGQDGVRVTFEGAKGEETVEGDVLMVAIGRRPITEGLGYEEAGVRLDRGFVQIDEYARTGPEGLYAVGDILPPYTLGLAHSSFQEGFLVAEQAAELPVVPIDYAGVPRVTYSHPEVGSVGYNEQELTERGVAFEKTTYPFSHNGRAMMMKESGHVKVLAVKDGGRVLGVHIVGPKATDLIAEGQLIYNWEALPTEVGQFIHPHPTLSEAVGEAHLAIAGKALHG